MRWDHKEHNEADDLLKSALINDFNRIYGVDANSLIGWQALCQAVRVDPIPSTLEDCRKVRCSIYWPYEQF
jgi:hypothetical protein